MLSDLHGEAAANGGTPLMNVAFAVLLCGKPMVFSRRQLILVGHMTSGPVCYWGPNSSYQLWD